MLTEKRHAGDFILNEEEGNYCRENVTLASGVDAFQAGTVLGKRTAGGKYDEYDQQAGDGTEAAAGILYDNSDPTSGDITVCIIRRGPITVVASLLIWPDGSPTDVTAGIADLLALGIVVRS